MDDTTKARVAAAAKMAVGSARMASAVATATGHGVVGAMCRKQHMMTSAIRIGKLGFEGGKAQFEDGLEDWKRS